MEKFNALSCICWLKDLAEHSGAAALLGNEYEPVVEMAKIYDLGEPTMDFYAESPLIGKPGVDLSVSYPGIAFLNDSLVEGHPLKEAGDFTHEYISLLAKHYPNILNYATVYLEGDTSKGTPEDLAVFLTLRDAAVYKILPELMKLQGMEERIPALENILRKCEKYLGLNQIGFMNSREGRPIRLNLVTTHDKLDDIFEGLKILGCEHLIKQCEEKLRSIEELEILGFVLGIDVLEDGSIGSTFGIEMGPLELLPIQHRRMFQTENYKKFVQLLKDWQLADARMEVIPKCSWDKNFSIETTGGNLETYLYSFPSHFKLKWNKEGPMPAKIYLSMRRMDKQHSINETIPDEGLY